MLIEVETIGAINVARTGPAGGRSLVLLHPVGLDLTWWGDQFDRFGRTHDVIAMDMPGHGLSDSLQAPPSFDQMAQAVEGVLEHLGVGQADLVGLSVGGMIAQTLALRRPDLVRSLTLVATLCTFPAEVRTALLERARVARSEGMGRIADLSIERWFTPAFRARRPDMLARARRSLLDQSGEFHARMWEMIAGLDLKAQLAEITCPTLVVGGEVDINAPPAAAALIADSIPGALLELMPSLGHFPPFEEPNAFNNLLDKFLITPRK